MCGLYYQEKGSRATALSAIRRMSHRGPDNQAVVLTRAGFLCHARLSIIDLDERSNQPLTSQDGRYAIIFNGEIYNYVELKKDLIKGGVSFRTESDTEVVLQLFIAKGEAGFKLLDGMFSIVLYDQEADEIWFLRDRFGEKPLFYTRCNQYGLRISSYFFSLSPNIDIEKAAEIGSMDHLLNWGYLPGEHTLDPKIKKLMPGEVCILERRSGAFHARRYVEEPLHDQNATLADLPLAQVQDDVWALLVDSVRKRMRTDVKYGFFLSGGLDSSLLVAAAAESVAEINTFTFKQTNVALDESVKAAQIAKQFGTTHTEISIEDNFNLLELMIGLDEPIGDSSYIPTARLCEAAARQVSVMIGGDGGDEIFLGYPRYEQLASLNYIPKHVRPLIKKILGLLPVGTRGREFAMSHVQGGTIPILNYTPYFNDKDRFELFKQPLFSKCTGRDRILTAKQFANYELTSLFLNDYLVKVDRAAMRSSLEVRLPYLSAKLFKYLSQLPEHYQIDSKRGGRIIQKLLYNQKVDQRGDVSIKKGFSFNYLDAFNAQCEDLIMDTLPGYGFENDLLNNLLKRKGSNSSKIFLLLSLACHIEGAR